MLHLVQKCNKQYEEEEGFKVLSYGARNLFKALKYSKWYYNKKVSSPCESPVIPVCGVECPCESPAILVCDDVRVANRQPFYCVVAWNAESLVILVCGGVKRWVPAREVALASHSGVDWGPRSHTYVTYVGPAACRPQASVSCKFGREWRSDGTVARQ